MTIQEQDSLLDDPMTASAATVESDPPSNAASETEAVQPEPNPVQEEMPFALVYGQAFTKLPQDLYIPPDALEVILEAFEGPLDLLLYLIKRQNLDILDVPVSQITSQYMEYVELMKSLNLELAAEYLVMAALLGEIKSRMLLPRQPGEEEEELDPRAELIRRLQEYERYKKAAEDIEVIPRVGREIHLGNADPPEYERPRLHPDVDLREVLLALQDVLHRADMFESHQVTREKLSTRERMTQVLERLSHDRFVPFVALFTYEEGRLGVVVTFLAILELVKESLVELVQSEACGPIHVRARAAAHEGQDVVEEDIDDGNAESAYEIRSAATDLPASDDDVRSLDDESFDPAALTDFEEPDAEPDPFADYDELLDDPFSDANTDLTDAPITVDSEAEDDVTR